MPRPYEFALITAEALPFDELFKANQLDCIFWREIFRRPCMV
jgi:hypothetical protein